MARQIALIPRYLYAAPIYLKTALALKHPNDLARHVLCMAQNAGTPQDDKKTFYRGKESVSVPLTARFAMNGVGLSRTLGQPVMRQISI